jgi:uncharacterized protein HemX
VRKHRISTVVLTIVAVLALAGIGLGAMALSKDQSTSSLQRQVNALQAELAIGHSALTTLQASSAHAPTARNVRQIKGNVSQIQGNVSQIQDSVLRLQNQLRGFTLCIPQLHQEVTGLNIQGSTHGGFIRTAFIQDPTRISQACAKLINGR